MKIRTNLVKWVATKSSILSAMLLCIAAISGCTRPASSSIDIIGSTTVTPLMDHLVGIYAQQHEQRFLIQSLGSTMGVNSVRDGQTPLGMSSRSLKQEEVDAGVIAHHIATEALAVAVHASNPITNLTSEQVLVAGGRPKSPDCGSKPRGRFWRKSHL
jgi:phosphate transport system substrate-binding protein